MDEMVKQTQEWLNKTYWLRKGFTKFKDEEIDGITGQGTFKRLIQALQIELNDKYNSGLTVDGDFGAGTLNALPSTIDSNYEKCNIVKIIQGSLWCKGYSAGPIDGDYGPKVTAAVKKFKEHAGVPGEGYISPYVLQGIMNTDAYFFNGESGTQPYFLHLVQKDMNSRYGFTFGLIAPNGIWERKSQKMLIKCCQKEWGISNPDGVWGNNTKSKAPTLSTKTGASSFDKTRLLQWALTVNGFYPGTFSGNFTSELKNKVSEFQEFMCLESDGIVGKGTWASLLSSKGDTSRTLKAFDTASRLTKSQAIYFKDHGYTDVGRYLVNANGQNVLDKKMTIEELKYISEAGLKVFPIYQTRGNSVGYFIDSSQGLHDAAEAEAAAHNLLFPNGTTIYFAVDYDVKTADIEKYIVPYFRNIKLGMGNFYRVGVYGPRAICNILAEHGLTSASFVADMSTGFTCNIGQPMPKNWAYEQVVEVQQGAIGIDKCAVSPRGTAIEWKLPSEPELTGDPVVDFKTLYGNLIKEEAKKLDLEDAILGAFIITESKAQGFDSNGRLIIRFENHHFIDAKSPLKGVIFDYDNDNHWKNHVYRHNKNENWITCHTNQDVEYDVFELAKSYDYSKAFCAISMGAPQILGENYAMLGYSSAEEMYEAFSKDVETQLYGMIDFITGTSGLIDACKSKDFRKMAELYNGPNNVDAYAPLIEQNYIDYTS